MKTLISRAAWAVIGLKHTLDIGASSYLRSIISYAYTNNEGEMYKYNEAMTDRKHVAQQSTTTGDFRISSFLNSKISSRLTMKAA